MDEPFLLFLAVGFVAQLVDGALGMAYGVISTSVLLGLGVPPAAASASVHVAEVFTTGVSGFFHHRLGNVDKALFRRLVIPGVIGGALGAYVLSSIPGDRIKPFVAAYLLAVGLFILRRAVRILRRAASDEPVDGGDGTTFSVGVVGGAVDALGLAGGFFDAVGGGGWGPIVTSSLVVKGKDPRSAVGSVNAAEFFVTAVQAATFAALLDMGELWTAIAGLVAGGILAAPLAAHAVKRIPVRVLLLMVGLTITALSVRTLWHVLAKG